MADMDLQMQLDELRSHVKAAEATAHRAEDRAAQASSIALAAIENQRHAQTALEASHTQMGEMLAMTRKMTNLMETLASSVLRSK